MEEGREGNVTVHFPGMSIHGTKKSYCAGLGSVRSKSRQYFSEANIRNPYFRISNLCAGAYHAFVALRGFWTRIKGISRRRSDASHAVPRDMRSFPLPKSARQNAIARESELGQGRRQLRPVMMRIHQRRPAVSRDGRRHAASKAAAESGAFGMGRRRPSAATGASRTSCRRTYRVFQARLTCGTGQL